VWTHANSKIADVDALPAAAFVQKAEGIRA
jgi:hypothetical protein